MSDVVKSPAKRSIGDQVFRGFYFVIALVAVSMILGVIGLGVGLAQGYRPVVLTSGSMSPTAPTGSLIIAQPVDRVEVGDILVMSNEARATVTHRIVEIERSGTGVVYAVTRGDANEEVDPNPYPLDGPQLIGRWTLPEFGAALLWLGSPFIGLVVVGGAVLALTLSAISYIWTSSTSTSPATATAAASSSAGGADSSRKKSSPGQKRFGMAIGLSVLFGFTGLAWSLYLGTDVVPGNAFSTADCFDARIGSVQSGQITSSANGVTIAPIAAVDPAASFVIHSVRSNSSKPGDSMVLADLSGPTTIEFIRQTDTPTPGQVVIEWSVVEYACGVTVQRGVVPGNNTISVDVPVTAVDPGRSFLLGGSIAAPTSTAFESDDLPIVELVNGDTVRFRTSAGADQVPARTLGYQLVTFADSGDARNQVVSTTLGSGGVIDTIVLASPVDPTSTMLIVAAASPNTGGGVGDRLVRARLLDGSTVEVQRGIGTGTVDVNVQVVELLEGTTVQHGVVNLAPAQATTNVSISPVDTTRTSVGSTVLVGGASSGGSTDEAFAGEPGEAMVTVDLLDATTVEVSRAATDSLASFAWQAITWGGPDWADPTSPFRQRIDVDAASVDVPNGYTTPLDLDHQDMVASDLSLSSGDDLRLWRFDGTGWTELDRVLDENSSWNTPVSRIWFKTQEPVSAESTISYWLYFGDPTPAVPLADPQNVWLIDEGFESGLGVFEDRTEGTAWYRADPWTRRIALTVDAATVASNLTDQIVLVQITNADLGANASADGSDILFTTAGGTRLAHEIESWSPGAGALTAWVLVPTLDSSTDTTLFAYYGAADAPLQAEPRSLWVGQRAAWNLASDIAGPAPTLDDAGPNNNDGLALGDTSRVASPTGFAAHLDGSTDRLESAPARLPGGSFTASVWFRADTLTSDAVLLSQGDPAVSGVLEIGVDATTMPGSPAGYASLRLDGSAVRVDGGLITAGAWHHFAVVWNQSTLDLVLDGAPVGSIAATGSLPGSRTTALVLGGDPAGARTLAGDLDQVRLRDRAVSVDQLAFEAANLSNPTAVVSAAAVTGGIYRDQGDWLGRRPITISAALADADVVDFPLLVELIDADLGANSAIDGADLVFTAADGVTRLDHDVERWDGATGALTAWVRLPLLSSSVDTAIFLYTGNPSAEDQTDPIGVWGPASDLVLTTP